MGTLWTVVVVVVTGLLPTVQADMPNTTVYHQSADQLIRVRGEKERKGRVEVRMSAESSRWYPVCYDVDIFTRDTMPNIALWLCETQLGLNVSRATIILGDVLPSDTQFALAVCSSRGNCSFSLAQECVTTRSWIAYCPAPKSTDFTVRLTGGASERKGGVETLIDGKWLPICSTLFDAKDAEVVCRQLGFRDSTVKVHKYHKFRTPGGNAMMLSFGCRGNESRLIECHQVSLRVSVPCRFIATMECESKKDYSPRLGDKSSNFFGSSGRLEVYLRGNWMPVCDARTIDDNVARVACREMGLPSTPALAILGTSLYRWDNILDRENVRFQCRGTEKSLSECTREVVHVCNGTVRIVCSEFSDYEVRLVGGNRKAGRVELRIGDVWGTICSQGFSDREAGVVCQKLGYFRAIKTVGPNEGFGQAAPDSVVWPFEFSCKGDEHSLEKCTRRRVTSGRCTHDKDVAVSCESSDDVMGLRLVGGTSVNSGRLEVHFNGLWGTVCQNDFSSSAAKVACRQMGLPSTQAKVLSMDIWPSAQGPIFLSSVRCRGNEANILSCPHQQGENSCSHDQDVAIECKETDTKRSSLSATELTAIRAIAGAAFPCIVLGVTLKFCIHKYRAKRNARTRRESNERREANSFVTRRLTSIGRESRVPRSSTNGVFFTNNSNTVQSPFHSSVMAWPKPPSPPANLTQDPPSYVELFPNGEGKTPDKTPPPPSYESVASTR